MSDYIPFEMQLEIIKRLPVKLLIQFRSVSKQWKSFIDNPEFIKTYHIDNPKHHLLVWYNRVPTYNSIIDDNTFPRQKFTLTAPELLSLLKYTRILGSVDGLLCFHGFYLSNKMVALWNPSVRICVGIIIPNVIDSPEGYTRIGFGVCRDTSDPTLVKINVVQTPSSICWDVHVFTLSSCVWKTVYTCAPFKSCDLMWNHVFIDGFIYWLTGAGFIISFDLKSEKFGEVCLPDTLVIPSDLKVVKVNESLGLLEYNTEGKMSVCSVWMRKCSANQLFTKMYTVRVEDEIVFNSSILGFRNNGDVVLGLVGDDYTKCLVEVYEPSSERKSGVGIKAHYNSLYASSYIETLLLLDQPNSIIH